MVAMGMGKEGSGEPAEHAGRDFAFRNLRAAAVPDREILGEPRAIAEGAIAAARRRLFAAVRLRVGGGNWGTDRVGSGFPENRPISRARALRTTGAARDRKSAHLALRDLPAARKRQSRSRTL